MGEIFRGIKGDLNGFGLENADISPNPADDTSDPRRVFEDEGNGIFDQDDGNLFDKGDGVINTRVMKKSKKIFTKQSKSDMFGGFGF